VQFSNDRPMIGRSETSFFLQVATGRRRPQCSGFSLLELLVVISVAVVMTGLLMPAIHQVHENANRLICMSNLQQLGSGFIMYSNDNNDFLPHSAVLSKKQPQDLMVARYKSTQDGWDGIGLLFLHDYCGSPECYYCPSHHGTHPYERYARNWYRPTPGDVVFTNYHYSGDVEWDSNRRRRLTDGYSLVLATDGLRTTADFNHIDGMNVLRADGSVRWREDARSVFEKLPCEETETVTPEYEDIWDSIESTD
jgi:prepilin-type N-terminal cleavage/methylation domain-containing protein